MYVNGSNGSDTAGNISIHHNLIHHVSKHGLNFADGTTTGIVVYDNVVFNTAYAGIRFNTNSLHGAKVFNNTFYEVLTTGNGSYGVLTSDWGLPADALDLQNNIFWAHAGSAYEGGSVGFDAVGTIKKNLWYGGSGSTAMDSAPITGNPNFVTPGSDFHLLAGPAVDVGSSAVASTVTTDFDATTPRPRGAGFDVGAYER